MASATLNNDSLGLEITRAVIDNAYRAEVFDDPFPHLTVRGLFPEDFYTDLIGSMPSDDRCLPIGEKTSVDKDSSCRLRFGLNDESLNQLSVTGQELWRAARQALQSEDLRRVVYEKLAKGLSYRFGCREDEVIDQAPGFALPEIYRETRGYRITPHPDTRKKVVTMQVSLAADESQSHLGTEFYRRSFSPAALRSAPVGFETIKTAPFTPNTASAFVVLNSIRLKSWHGRTALSEQSGARNSILNIWYAKASDVKRGTPNELPQKAAA